MIDCRFILPGFVALALTAALAPAVTADSAVEAHFKRGERLFESGLFREAAQEFQAAYDQDPNPLLLLNTGHCFRKAGDVDMALHLYRKFLDNAPRTLAKERELAEQRVAELEKVKAKADGASLLATSGALEPRPETPATPRPLYKRWWFWTSIAAAAAAGTVAVFAISRPRELDIPSTPLGTYEAR